MTFPQHTYYTHQHPRPRPNAHHYANDVSPASSSYSHPRSYAHSKVTILKTSPPSPSPASIPRSHSTAQPNISTNQYQRQLQIQRFQKLQYQRQQQEQPPPPPPQKQQQQYKPKPSIPSRSASSNQSNTSATYARQKPQQHYQHPQPHAVYYEQQQQQNFIEPPMRKRLVPTQQHKPQVYYPSHQPHIQVAQPAPAPPPALVHHQQFYQSQPQLAQVQQSTEYLAYNTLNPQYQHEQPQQYDNSISTTTTVPTRVVSNVAPVYEDAAVPSSSKHLKQYVNERTHHHPLLPESAPKSPSSYEPRKKQSSTFIGSMSRELFIDVCTSYIDNLIEKNEREQMLKLEKDRLNQRLSRACSSPSSSFTTEDEDELIQKHEALLSSGSKSTHSNSPTCTEMSHKKHHQSEYDQLNPSPTSIIENCSPCTSTTSSSCSNNITEGILPNHLQPESVFFSITKPSISTFAYISRIISYTNCSPSAFIIMLIYLQKIGQVNERLKVTQYNLHRLLVTSLMLACKWVDDITYTMQHYGKIGGIPTSKEMERLEIQFLKYLNFNMHVNVEDYYTMQHDLDSLALNML